MNVDIPSMLLGMLLTVALIILAALLIPVSAWLLEPHCGCECLYCPGPAARISEDDRRIVRGVKSVLHGLRPSHYRHRREAAEHLAELRYRHGWTRMDMARRLGLPDRTVMDIEAGGRSLDRYCTRYMLAVDADPHDSTRVEPDEDEAYVGLAEREYTFEADMLDLLSAARERRGLSAGELDELLNVPAGTIEDVELGRTRLCGLLSDWALETGVELRVEPSPDMKSPVLVCVHRKGGEALTGSNTTNHTNRKGNR